eukprot:TRINITY_DN121659_c0_g1_i1.p2 TRINITY_DN121659_c0_g1~~TRINITY_DN121659_c0_g1_i1.p2  ORF type:complete len:547 (+),score=202.83 TRINITY_DN121659_c0_g1_i1:67-1707(+)
MVDQGTQDRKVVIDAGAVIKGQRIERFGGSLYTTNGVLAEIRDEHARNLLQTLPEELKIREPLPQDRAYAKEFAKATGDLGFLSANDMDLISLTVALCREQGLKLREKPKDFTQETTAAAFDWAPAAKQTATAASEQPAGGEEEAAGKEEEEAKEAAEAKASAPAPGPAASAASVAKAASAPKVTFAPSPPPPQAAAKPADLAAEEDEDKKAAEPAAPLSWAAKAAAAKNVRAPPAATPKPRPCGPPPKRQPLTVGKEEPKDDKAEATESKGEDAAEDSLAGLGEAGDAAAAAAAVAAALEADDSEDDDEGLDDERPRPASHEVEEEDEDGDSAGEWVTPDNMHRFGMTVASATDIKVTCATSDYSVQNVLLQMGITPLTFDGYAVRSVKLWGLICRGCFFFTRDSEKVFCPKCGHDTVVRVPIVVGEDGQPTVLNSGRPLRKKGSIFSMPKIQGGRAWKPLMAEDEIYIGGRDRELRRAQKQAERERAARDPFDVDNGAKDWYARSGTAKNGYGGSGGGPRMMAGFGRRLNPNANNFKGFRKSKK